MLGFEVLTAAVIRVKSSGMKLLSLLPASFWFLAWLNLRPSRWRPNVPPKGRLTFNGLHGVISQKTELFGVMLVWEIKPSDRETLLVPSLIELKHVHIIVPLTEWDGEPVRLVGEARIHECLCHVQCGGAQVNDTNQRD
jgi:hypothetical protein